MKAINSLPKLYRKDPFINELYKGAYSSVNFCHDNNISNYNNIFFRSLDTYGLSNWEYDLEIEPLSDIGDRRNRVESKFKASERCTKSSLQSLASRYFGRDVTVEYNGDANVIYRARLGFKTRYTDDTYNAWYSDNSVVFPAHMIMTWIYEKNRWRDYATSSVWGDGLNLIWNDWDGVKSWGNVKGGKGGKTWGYVATRTWDDHLNKEID